MRPGAAGSVLALRAFAETLTTQSGTEMTPYGFVEIANGSDAYVQNLVELACRLSGRRRVVLRVEPSARARVEALLESLSPGGDRSRIELLDAADRSAAIPAVQASGYCVFNDTEMAAYLREDQVAVYSMAGRRAK